MDYGELFAKWHKLGILQGGNIAKFNDNHDEKGRFASGNTPVAKPQPGSNDGSKTSHILSDAQKFKGHSYTNKKGNAECVEFARQVGGAPHTSDWTPGDYISPKNPPPKGTWVATFVNGRYYGHVGVFNGFDEKGNLSLIDQFNKKEKVGVSYYHVKGKDFTGHISNDPSQYRIVRW